MAIEIEKKTYVSITAEEFVSGLKDYEVGEVLGAVAERFDKNFSERRFLADEFADNLSELACRFLAEVVTSHYARNIKDK